MLFNFFSLVAVKKKKKCKYGTPTTLNLKPQIGWAVCGHTNGAVPNTNVKQ